MTNKEIDNATKDLVKVLTDSFYIKYFICNEDCDKETIEALERVIKSSLIETANNILKLEI